MMRLMLLPLLLCTLSIGCFAQTFQYSRGWTNGKRSLTLAKPQQQEHPRYFTREDDNTMDPELFEENMAERYFMQLPRIMRNALLARTLRTTTAGSLNSNALENGSNNLFGSHHQSNEVFDELNGVNVVEPTNFAKH